MPLYMKPNRKVSVQDVMNGMRDHYEGTPFDVLNELGSGSYNMPYRPTPLEWESDGKKYFNERPVSTQQTAFSFVGQMRSQLPDAIGGVVWVTNDDPNMAPYVPLYCSISEVPKCFRRVEGVQDDVTFSWESAFWLQNAVSNMVYPYYEKMFPDVKKFRDAVENAFLSNMNQQDLVLSTLEKKQGKSDADKAELIQKVTLASGILAEGMMASWKDLFEYLVVKHLDMAVKKEVEEPMKKMNKERFKKTEHGFAEPPVRPGYPEAYRRQIVKETGDKYLMK
jgi:dipeptidase